ncbi:hypothetical protein ACFSUS_24465 [Spirosoma soli]|uniref:Uncharacterized protein n=1 Tax=Spirosoma soli TaxID=1770529 RepID=A0ABW5M9U0_9BACT
MNTRRYKPFVALVGWLTAVTLTSAQTPTPNQQAVDTLVKDVATAVFANIKQPKAQEIYAQLLTCGDGCDPQQLIRSVGSWDQVGTKLEELGELKNIAQFVKLPPTEANTAIKKQLAAFYARYKNDQNYGKPLNPAVQAQMLAKIDELLPPAEAAEPPATVAQQGASTQPDADTVAEDGNDVDGTALRISQLERQVENEQKNQVWMILLSVLAGALLGAGAVYLLAYRKAAAEVKRLLDENSKLSRSVDTQRITAKPVNSPRQPEPNYKQKADAYDAILAELGNEPLAAIQQLKQQSAPTASVQRSGEPVIESVPEPVMPPVPIPTPPLPVQMQTQASAPNGVFYFPPPDPNGVFDMVHQSPTLSPESAYRFVVNTSKPDVASFRFEAEPGRLARFLTYRNYMIEPACDSENSYSSVHTRIVMRRDGEAVLENGNWRVKTKALIRYE